MAEFEFSDAEREAATRRAKAEAAGRPTPKSVRYDRPSGRILVEFENGSAFMVPARSLQGLEEASDDDLAEVELLGTTGLHWEKLDVDFTIPGLMAGIFGTARYMQQKGGRSRSPAKAAAARENGKKGGRPRKVSDKAR
ncbi:DUF2442 domain-containing protein [Afifella marina]|uniref:DUF2442 domain-containing protein n=1 Tax=Afifella marina DSM 2698 TaxID=1120955 RepID=A0A1G5M4D7_AFIMA|nr:DUF2442 domain-containing protein [Afifella marina]MBK1622989.1 DUF2442 domain-containing protein [Afifella marina DSM 2698]MBK1625983.1 DUF2442 domain-containing protein [Afifella marina]MBK5917807.1 hypothetical protein [Afifella marina]RAI18247.1 hypothetical protein CH311_16305 [Afifella marina DSM 2698]SCZ20057.1 Protein of unknown function [Afifella marina DSM 2698]